MVEGGSATVGGGSSRVGFAASTTTLDTLGVKHNLAERVFLHILSPGSRRFVRQLKTQIALCRDVYCVACTASFLFMAEKKASTFN